MPRGASQAFLRGVSCAAVTSCTAAGWAAVNRGFDDVTVVERWNAMSWTMQRTPNPASQAFMNAVWCGSPGTCRAVGYYFPLSGEKSLAEGD